MSELYYAEMEAARNKAEDEYFKARPGRDSDFNRMLFAAGFERAFEKLWKDPSPPTQEAPRE